MAAHAAINGQIYDVAEELLMISWSESWSILSNSQLSSNEQAIAVTLLERLAQHHGLSGESKARLAQMRQSLQQSHPALELPLANVLPQGQCATIFSAVAALSQ